MQADEDQEADESEADTVAEVAYNATAEVQRSCSWQSGTHHMDDCPE